MRGRSAGGAVRVLLGGSTSSRRGGSGRVAVSPHLWVALAPVFDEITSGPLFPDGKDLSVPMVSYRYSTRYVTRGWELAVEDGVARVTVAKPPNRQKASPTHCFRSGFMACLAEAGVSDAVLDHLVGHAPGTVRGKHYASPSLGSPHRAVALIPPLDAG